MKLTLENITFYGKNLRVHGNAFLQLDLPNDQRLHIWPEERLETQKVYTGIHNHRFSFVSKILLGRLTHIEYDVQPSDNGSYHLYKTIRTKDGESLAQASASRFKLTGRREFRLAQGSYYEFSWNEFHESYGTGLTATLMEKTAVNEDIDVLTLCPWDKEPDLEYDWFSFNDDYLWDIIKGVFDKIYVIEV